ncbi:uncharacterized protein LOC126157246 isoform X1 [Schistocerca cancellata]|uniref:uncharacterized protein LOC126157246 isoform X1 n=1 Tax=Schistocerca cancellata TaxID=274614 RepID=UPI0021193744|nr:uncharacterized protein LOC126157246 isoform X1 [Schistocerca cancellata]
MIAMEWLEDDVMLLIEEYRHHRCLWDPRDPEFKMHTRKNEAWQEIAEALKVPTEEVKKKINSLLASFRRERRKEATTSGMPAGKKYRSGWFAFKSMSFLLDKVGWTKGRCSEQSDPLIVGCHSCIILWENTVEEVDIDVTSLDGCEDEGTSNDVVLQTEYPASDEVQVGDVEEPPRKKNKCRKGDAYDEAAADLNMIINIIDTIRNKKQATNNKQEKKSPRDIFSDYVAFKLKTYNNHVQNIVQFKIHEVFFQADMGNFDSPSTTTNQQTEIIQASPSSSAITIDTNDTKHSDTVVHTLLL